MSKQSVESWHDDIEFDPPKRFVTPDAVVVFDREAGTSSFRRNDEKAIFTVGAKYKPRNIDPTTDEIVLKLGAVTPAEFCDAAVETIQNTAQARNSNMEARQAAEADYERLIAAAMDRVDAGDFSAAEASLLWMVYKYKTWPDRTDLPQTGVVAAYGGTETILDRPRIVPEPNKFRASLPA